MFLPGNVLFYSLFSFIFHGSVQPVAQFLFHTQPRQAAHVGALGSEVIGGTR